MKLDELDKEMAYRWKDNAAFVNLADEYVDQNFFNSTAHDRQQRKKRLRTAGIVLAVLLLTVGVFTYLGTREKTKMRGMILNLRNESLPLALPPGEQRLRMNNVFYRHGLLQFTPYIASTQTVGQLNVITNYTVPHYQAYTVRHPAILDVVMISDEFFCSQKTCFFVMDVHNDKYFERPTTKLWDFTHHLREVPLPAGMTFVKAENCGHVVDSRNCHIVMQNAKGEYHFGDIMHFMQEPVPSIADLGPSIVDLGRVVDFPSNLTKAHWELRAFQRLFNTRFAHPYDRLVIWHDDKLKLITIDHVYGKFFPTILEGVDRDEIVEMHKLSLNHIAVLVMKEGREQRGKDDGRRAWAENEQSRTRTRVRVFIYKTRWAEDTAVEDHTLLRMDELFIYNRPASVTILRRKNIDYDRNIEIETFEVCELAEFSKLHCFVNSQRML